jgi:hypothetical protein
MSEPISEERQMNKSGESFSNAPLRMICSKDNAAALITEKMFFNQMRSLLMCGRSPRSAGRPAREFSGQSSSIPKRNVQCVRGMDDCMDDGIESRRVSAGGIDGDSFEGAHGSILPLPERRGCCV